MTATFSLLPTFTVTLSGSGQGTGTATITNLTTNIAVTCTSTAGVMSGTGVVGGVCSPSFPQGTNISLSVSNVNAGSAFAGWGGACTGTGGCSITNIGANQSVTATFNKTTITITGGTGTGIGTVTGTDTVTSTQALNCTGVTSGSAACTTTVTANHAIALSAQPQTGSLFSGWSGGGCTGTGSCNVTVSTSPISVTATFSPVPTFALTLTGSGGGTGTVSIKNLTTNSTVTCTSTAGVMSGTGVVGGVCSPSFPQGTNVSLTASNIPAGSAFSGWSGGACTGTAPCTVTMNAAVGVTATFLPQFTVTVTGSGAGNGSVTSTTGGISCTVAAGVTTPNPCVSSLITQNTSVGLAATPATGYVFTGWSGGGANCAGTGACSITITNANVSVGASFALPSFPLTASVTGSGSVSSTSNPSQTQQITSCTSTTGTCSATYTQNTSVTLTATAGSGFVFSGWSGGSCVGTGTCTVNMTAATTVSATFLQLFTLSNTVASTGGGTGTVTSSPTGITCSSGTCTAPFASGTGVSLAAAPATGSVLSSWGGGCSGSAACGVTMSSNQSVTATFGPAPPPQYTVTAALSGTGSVASVDGAINCGSTCTANYTSGTTVTLNASAPSGFAFAGWSSSACSGTGSCVFNISAPITVTANFVAVVPLTVSVTGSGGGTVTSNPLGITCPGLCSANFNQGSTVVLTATPDTSSGFSGWSSPCSGIGTCSITMNGAQSVSADFEPAKTIAGPTLSPSPSPFGFGSVKTNTTVTQNVQISNTGPSSGGNLNITAATVDNGLFAISSTQFPMSIAPGSSLPLAIAFTPTATGTVSGNVTFTSNATNPSTTLPVSGTGSTTTSTGGLLSVGPSTLYFGTVAVGTTVTQTATMSNPGTGSTTVSAGTVSGSGFNVVSPTFPLTLAAGASQVVTVSFSPPTADPVTGVITFTSNASGSNPVVSLVASGNGTTPVTSITATPTSFTFGNVITGTTSLALIGLYNTGNQSVTVSGATISGSGAFSADTTVLPVTLPVNSSQQVTMAFTPLSVATFGGTITFNTTSSGVSASVSVGGNGVIASAHTVSLSWSASTSTVLGYNVYRSTSQNFGFQKINGSAVSFTSFTDNSVASGQTYYYKVTAVGSGALESGFSNLVIASIPNP
ncbi:MAG: beta strand repeat-containing protein [Terriglobales bacterium]